MNAALMTKAAQFSVVMRQFRPVLLPRAGTPLQPNFTLGFTVHQIQAAIGKRRIYFWPAQNLDHRDVQIKRS